MILERKLTERELRDIQERIGEPRVVHRIEPNGFGEEQKESMRKAIKKHHHWRPLG